MARSTGEMPFLEHLEELRVRLIKSLGAVVVGAGLGIWLVDRLALVQRLQAPILPLLEGRHLVVQGPTEPVMIWLKLGVITGLVLASPVILWQLWAFLAPALYAREKKAIVPSLFAGMVLFITGATLSFLFVVPQALRVLLSFQAGSFEILITFDKYFGFVLQVVLAMGLSAELPLVIIVLAALGVITPAMLNKFRRFAVVGAFIAGAILSPGTDVFSMLLMTVPLLVLYEIGVLGAWLIHRRRRKAAAAISAAILCLAFAGPVQAQRPTPRPPPQQPTRQDSLADTGRVARPIDSASARRMGLPSAPKLTFPAADSIIDELLDLEGYDATRYRADTARVEAIERRVQLDHDAMTERGGSTLEARTIAYREGDCRFEAQGDPHLFQQGTVVVGDSVKYDTCANRGLVREGLTSFPQQGANWFIRGHIAMDSSSSRIYASAKEVTSCDLPESHYHFSARELKWVSQSTMVARPAVLYVRDVPIAWIPFLFQDTKRGRRSGILIPEFGFNDIVRPSRNYNRTVKNLGYYWAANDYFDILARFDWFADRYTELGFESQYRWIDRFVRGALSFSRSKEVGGGSSSRIVWNHQQTFNNTTRFNVQLDYSTNSRIVFRNTVDPTLTTQNIHSSANLNKQFKWGNAAIGFTRAQNISDNSGTQTLPSFSLSPKPIDFGPNITWSPDLNFTNDLSFKQPFKLLVPRGSGGPIDTLNLTSSSRVSQFSLNTPIRIGGFNWTNSVRLVDTDSTGLREELVRVPDETTPDPTDSVTVRRLRAGGFGSAFDWTTGINLPILFRTTWKLTPGVNIVNTSSGPGFAVRNDRTGGQWVTQGKRLEFSLALAPTFYGFFGGVGPFARIRHTISPSLTYAYSPAATIPLAFAQATAPAGGQIDLSIRPRQAVSLTLNQNFEAKYKPAPGDTSTTNARKMRLLSISTSGISYDFEQAKEPGRTGWVTQTLTNSFLSDLVPGFNLSVTHDLFRGQAGSDTARFSPFLSNVTASFALTSQTFLSIGRLLGLVSKPDSEPAGGAPTGPSIPQVPNPFGTFEDMRRGSAFTSNQNYTRGSRGFNANINYTLTRFRPNALGQLGLGQRNQSNISLQSSFAPTRFWQVNWTTQYNATLHRFEAQQLNLTRDLHDWRATFAFTKAPQGNFAFSFLITLIDLPDIKFDYRQTTIQGR